MTYRTTLPVRVSNFLTWVDWMGWLRLRSSPASWGDTMRALCPKEATSRERRMSKGWPGLRSRVATMPALYTGEPCTHDTAANTQLDPVSAPPGKPRQARKKQQSREE